MLADGAMGARGWVYEGGPPSLWAARQFYLITKEKFISLLCLSVKLTQMLYIPWVGQRHPIFHGKANASGLAYFFNPEGPLPAGGEFVEPCSVQDPSQDEVASPELPTVHESLMIAPERLL